MNEPIARTCSETVKRNKEHRYQLYRDKFDEVYNKEQKRLIKLYGIKRVDYDVIEGIVCQYFRISKFTLKRALKS